MMYINYLQVLGNRTCPEISNSNKCFGIYFKMYTYKNEVVGGGYPHFVGPNLHEVFTMDK